MPICEYRTLIRLVFLGLVALATKDQRRCDLEDLLRSLGRSPIPEARTGRLFRQVREALGAEHARQVARGRRTSR